MNDNTSIPPTDPVKLVEWSQTPEGAAWFARLNQRLMEERLNAEAAGQKAPSVTVIPPHQSTLTREEAGQ